MLLQTPSPMSKQKQSNRSYSNKNAKADQLRVAIRTVMARAELKYGPSSAKYKKFGTEALSQQSDSDLLITRKIVVRVGTDF